MSSDTTDPEHGVPRDAAPRMGKEESPDFDSVPLAAP